MGDLMVFETFPVVILLRALIVAVALGFIAATFIEDNSNGWRAPVGLIVGACAFSFLAFAVLGAIWNIAIGGAAVLTTTTLTW